MYPLLFSSFVLVLLSCLTSGSSASSAKHPWKDSSAVSAKFKAPNLDTPAELAEQWRVDDETLWNYVNEKVPAVLEHTGAEAFDVHLKGVQAILRYWNAPDHLTNAGLFHSLYGTEGFQGFALPLSERSAIQSLIGERSERLCWIFCMVDRKSVDDTVFAWSESDKEEDAADEGVCRYNFRSRPELGSLNIPLESKEEWLDFIELTLSDWLEQVEGAAEDPSRVFLWKQGEAYAYRRKAYAKMSTILSQERPERLNPIVPNTHAAVMETEAPETQNLVQPRTPPMSEAAALALEALRSSGEIIPRDLSPQPETVATTSS